MPLRIDPVDSSARQKVFSRRTLMLGGGMSALMAVVAGRLYQLQIVDGQKYRGLAEENQFKRRILPPLRGEIVDRFGRVMASNRQNFRLLLIPEQVRDIDATLDAVSAIIPLERDRRLRIKHRIRRGGGFTPVEIRNNLSWEEFTKVSFQLPHLAGVLPDIGETRSYPLADASAFVVGYVGPVTGEDFARHRSVTEQKLLRQPGYKTGRAGLEYTYDRELRGSAGEMKVRINAHGRVVEELAETAKQPVTGSTLVLSIDALLQKKTMDILKGESASAVVLDVSSGDILAMASTPAFDPDAFNVGISPQLWDQLKESPYKPLLNKPLAGLYAPGSTFKMISAVAAMENGVSPDHVTQCNGRMWYGDRFFHCWKKGGHGPLDMRGAIRNSCNVYFYEIARNLDIDLLADTARRFGLGTVYDLGIPGGQKGVIPDRAWKRSYFSAISGRQAWFPGETLSCVVGQGYVTATPLQLAVMTARLATGMAVYPRLVRKAGDREIPETAPLPVDVRPEYLRVVQEGMDAVVNRNGTGARARLEDPAWRLAGKTGTSQVFRITQEDRQAGRTDQKSLPWERRDHALFVCYMPYERPRYACSVVVEHGISGSAAAATRARDIMRAVAASYQPGHVHELRSR